MGKIVDYTKVISRYFTASLIPMVLNLAINPLVSLAMDPEDFAITGYFTSFSTLITPIIIFYLLHYYNKRFFELNDEEREHLRALLFKMLVFFSAIISVICTIVLLIYIKQQPDIHFPTFPYLYLVILAIPLSGIYSLQLAQYKMERDSKRYMNYSVTKGILGVICTVLFVILFRWGAFGKLLGPLVVELGFFVFLIIQHKDVWKIKNSLSEAIPILQFCLPLVIGASLGYFFAGYDKTVLAKLGNDTEFGYYCVGASIAGYLGVFTSSISSTFQPDIYEAIIKNNKTKLFKVAALRWALTLAVVVLFVLFCPFIIKVLTAGRYMQSTGYARIFACTCLVSSIYYIINDYTIARGLPRYYLYTTILGSFLVVLTMPYFVTWFGYNGGAIANIASFMGLCFINLLLLLIHGLIVKHRHV